MNNSKFSESIDLIYLHEVDIDDSTDSTNTASYLDLQLEYDNEDKLTHMVICKHDNFLMLFIMYI